MNTFAEEDYPKRVSLRTWRQILTFAAPFRRNMVLMIFLMTAIAAIDAANPFFTRWIIDHVIIPKEIASLPRFGGIYALMVAVQALIIWLFISQAGKVEMGVCYEIRKAGFRKLQELSFSYYDRTPVGWIMARMTSDTSKLAEVMAWGMIDMTWGSALMVLLAGSMVVVNWKLALITLAVVPVLVVVSIAFQRRILDRYRKVRKTNSRITGAVNEGIMGAKTTKTLVREDANLREFQVLTGELREQSVRAAVLSALFLPVVVTLGSIGTALALLSGGPAVAAGTLSYGTLVAFVFCSIQFFDPIMELSRVFADIQYAQASAERVISLINTQPDIVDAPALRSAHAPVIDFAARERTRILGEVEFEDVGFAYTNGERVLDGFNLKVAPGERIALVGETGSGKSTIVNLVCRFYEPTSGKILIDGIDYKSKPLLWLHSNLGYVLQSPHLFSGTVMENIRYGRLDAGDDDVIRAAKLVNAHLFIERLAEGYQTEAGEGGARLSTGEKQLISFARAILADPSIFVLDEATSSIDTETEQLIQRAIEKVLQGRTSFIVAHRLSTVRRADRILVIANGEIAEQGTHGELLGLRGYYFRLYTNQFREEAEARLLDG